MEKPLSFRFQLRSQVSPIFRFFRFSRFLPISRFSLILTLGSLMMSPLCFSPVLGQKGYSPGYVIHNNGDTLQGMIRDRSDDKIYTRIKFKSETTGRQKYSPHQISGYNINGKEYESMWFDEQSEFFMFDYYNQEGRGDKEFLRVEARGPVSLYYREFLDPDNGYPDELGFFKRETNNYFQRATQGLFGLKKKKLAEYFRDCPDLVRQIESGHIKSPLGVVEYYNVECAKSGSGSKQILKK